MLMFLDVETTGLNPASGDAICEIALIGFSWEGKMLSRYVRLVNPLVPISERVSAIHGITSRMVETADPFFAIAEEVKKCLEEAEYVLGYNVKFDLDFLMAEFSRCNVSFPGIRYIDVLELVRRYLPRRGSYNLSRIARDLGFKFSRFHWAEEDVIATAYVFFYIVKSFDKVGQDLVCEWVHNYPYRSLTGEKGR